MFGNIFKFSKFWGEVKSNVFILPPKFTYIEMYVVSP